MKKIIITGANGFLGRALCRWFAERGWNVVGLTRSDGVVPEAKSVIWDGATLDEWAGEFEGADVVINLAGRSVNCRYGAKNKKAIFDSRLKSTAIIGEAICQCESPPGLWLNSSTATIYRHAQDRPQDEETGEIGSGFSVEVAMAWERTFRDSAVPEGVRKVALRSALVLANEAGTVFDYLRGIVRLGLGGKMGDGQQMMSWIHIDDFCRAIDWMIGRDSLQDFYNLSAPNPVTNATCMAGFRRIAGRRIGLPATRWMLEIGTFLMRTETELVLKSRWVLPSRLEAEGFQFQWPEFSEAINDLANPPG